MNGAVAELLVAVVFFAVLAALAVWYLTASADAQAYCHQLGLITVVTPKSWACVEAVTVP